jgi:hypothetical protein
LNKSLLPHLKLIKAGCVYPLPAVLYLLFLQEQLKGIIIIIGSGMKYTRTRCVRACGCGTS